MATKLLYNNQTSTTSQQATTAAMPAPTGFSYVINSDNWPFIVAEVVVRVLQASTANTAQTIPLILQVTGTATASVPFIYIPTSGAHTDWVTMKAVFTDINAGDVVQFNIGAAPAQDSTTFQPISMMVWGSS
jgi:hypothetical protein